jgi:hypothetical protein
VSTGECSHEGRFSVVDMPCCTDYAHFTSTE